MKTRISADGPLVVGQDYYLPIGLSIGFTLFIGMLDVGLLILAFYGGPSGSLGALDGFFAILINVAAGGFLVWALWFTPIEIKFVLSTDKISILNRAPFETRSATYPIADVDRFDVRYFERYRSTKMGALIEMYLRSGEVVTLMKLPSISLSETALTAMSAWCAANDRPELISRRSSG